VLSASQRDFVASFVEHDHVSEGAADIYADTQMLAPLIPLGL
jgi:hypothetical protein